MLWLRHAEPTTYCAFSVCNSSHFRDYGPMRHNGSMDSHTRWTAITSQNPDHSRWYIERFEKMRAAGVDLGGRRIIKKAIAPRGARIIDAGCGPGRTAIELARRGHAVIGLDIDAELIREANRAASAAQVAAGDVGEVSGEELAARSAAQAEALATGCQGGEDVAVRLPHPDDLWQIGSARFQVANICDPYPPGVNNADLIVCAGNVMTFLEDIGPQLALRQFAAALAANGQIVVGFGTQRGYPVAAFEADCQAAGLVISQRFATWQLAPWSSDADFLVAFVQHDASHQSRA